MIFGIKYGGANSSKKGRNELIFLPITQLQLMLSMGIAEIFLLSEPNYTVTIGSENYFSLAVGAFIAGIFIFVVIAIRVGSTIRFKETQKEKIIVKQN